MGNPVFPAVSHTDVVSLCIEGGADSINQVYESLTREISVLVCEGSGRISDLIASCHNDSRLRWFSLN